MNYEEYHSEIEFYYVEIKNLAKIYLLIFIIYNTKLNKTLLKIYILSLINLNYKNKY